MSIRLHPLHPHLGVEITGCDLSRPVPADVFHEIFEAFKRYSVVVIRGQRLEPAHQIAFQRLFGVPKISPRKQFHLPGHPEISTVGNTLHPDGSPAAFLDRHGYLWHSDTASDARPDAVTMLYSVKTPATGGETLFTSLHAAWESLPEETQRRIDGLQVTHNFNKHNDYLLAKDPGSARPLTPEERARHPDRIHDLVQTHPGTGCKLYYVTPTLVKSISGMDEAESEAFARELVRHATRPGCVFEHKWADGDLVFWDNRAVLHSATDMPPAGDPGFKGWRLLHRSYSYIEYAG